MPNNKQRLKLLYITNQICGSGGLERVLSIKASYLAEKLNYEVHIVTLNQGTTSLFYDFSRQLIYHDITTKGSKLNYFLTYRNGLKKIVNQVKPNIISVCDDGLKGLFVPHIINKPCPMVYERHVSKNIEIKSDKSNIFNKIKIWTIFKLMNLGGANYNKFIVLTNGNLKEWGLKNLLVIPNPLSFYPKNDEVSKLTNKKVLAVGKQCYQKGYDRLLQSWKLVNKKHPDWALDIYGTISQDEKLNELAEQLNISKSVTFYKPVKNIFKKYKETSIYVMSSRYEGFGMVLTEAMSYGVPCISFNCPFGPSDIISNDEDGYLVENGDVNKLAERIIHLMENPTLRSKMGQDARRNVERFLPDVIVPKWDNLFKNLLTN